MDHDDEDMLNPILYSLTDNNFFGSESDHNEENISFIDGTAYNSNFSLSLSVKEHIQDSPRYNTSSPKKSKRYFVVFTERALRHDAIEKKINKYFYRYMINTLNELILNKLNQNEKKKCSVFKYVSHSLIKTVKDESLMKISQLTLKEILENDQGNNRYSYSKENQKMIKQLPLKQNNDEAIQFIHRQIIDIYRDFLDYELPLVGPSNVIEMFKEIRKNNYENYVNFDKHIKTSSNN